MSSIDDYAGDLRSAGFVDITPTDPTGDWAAYAADRLQAWQQNHEAYARVTAKALIRHRISSTRSSPVFTQAAASAGFA